MGLWFKGVRSSKWVYASHDFGGRNRHWDIVNLFIHIFTKLSQVDVTRVLITGASGFIGSHLTKKLADDRNEVVVLYRDAVPSLWLEEALENCVKVRGDIRNLELLKRVVNEYEIEHVYHLAGETIVGRAYRDPINTFETNLTGTLNMLEVCRQLDVKQVLVQSTDKVYGAREEAREEDRLVPLEPYNTSKICQDYLARCYVETYGMKVAIPRCCNVYGYDRASRIVPNIIRSCLREDPPVLYAGEEETTRQYIYVGDTCNALTFIMKKNWIGPINVGTNDVLTQAQVVRRICQHFGIHERLVERQKTFKQISKQSMNWSRFRTLGWGPQFTFDEGIKLTIEAFKRYRGDWDRR